MKECRVICDRCHAEILTGSWPSTPSKDGWRDVEIKLEQYNIKTFTLCPKCLKELGMVNEGGAMKKISEPTIQEKVFNMLCEIAQMAVGGNE